MQLERIERRVWAEADEPAELRRDSRINVIGSARILLGKNVYSSILLDLSPHGAAFCSFGPFKPNDFIELMFDNGSIAEATVMWDDGVRTGCQFVERLSVSKVGALSGSSC